MEPKSATVLVTMLENKREMTYRKAYLLFLEATSKIISTNERPTISSVECSKVA